MLRRRKFLSVLMLGMLSLLLLVSVSVPLTFTTRAFVPFTLNKTMEQLEQPQQISKWFLPATDGIPQTEHMVSVVDAMPGYLTFSLVYDGTKKQFPVVVSRDPSNSKNCIVSLPVVNTLWKEFIDPDPHDDIMGNSIRNLERFTNSTRLYYGYPIARTTISDSSSLYITTSTDTTKSSIQAGILLDSLIQYAGLKKIRYFGKRILYSRHYNTDSVQVFASILVNSTAEPKPSAGIIKKPVTAGKDMLVAEYSGPYRNVPAVYKALEQYKKDYSLVGASVPYEEYHSPGYGFQPDDSVQLKVCFPVF
ncbi:hypothetical protein [Flavihumibacter solisilvae]|uniref:Bacterial transcription activator effector binding domain-containing protein n=1 Tax=Flavihumibacter solisilvae TaxID=1349421 RepID=A0A0C1LBI4_9BACT|nr:hypothetical protein [Flavihumibacter solisilvae]KIC92883.1 hypothetical protein OI18_20945 [Flavihumibacter solisilvae]